MIQKSWTTSASTLWYCCNPCTKLKKVWSSFYCPHVGLKVEWTIWNNLNRFAARRFMKDITKHTSVKNRVFMYIPGVSQSDMNSVQSSHSPFCHILLTTKQWHFRQRNATADSDPWLCFLLYSAPSLFRISSSSAGQLIFQGVRCEKRPTSRRETRNSPL